MIRRTTFAAFGLVALMAAPPVWADADSDGPVTTSDGGPGVYSLDDQISAWHGEDVKPGDNAPLAPEAPGVSDRKPHGVVSLGIGTGGYRSAYARSDLPVGETGTLSLAISEDRGRFWGIPYRARSLMVGLDFRHNKKPDCKALLDAQLEASPWRRDDDLDYRAAMRNCEADAR